MPLILPGNVASATAGGYEVANSCRFNAADDPYFSRTLGTATNRKKFTISVWVKLGSLVTGDNNEKTIFAAGSDYSGFHLDGNSDPALAFNIDNSDGFSLVTTQVLRDHSAWYHLVAAVDTTQGTEANRVKFYINGSQVSNFDTSNYPDQNYEPDINSAVEHRIGKHTTTSGTRKWDGYMAEFVFIDGTQYAASDFGESDEDSPTIWKPKDVSELTFGTNGFYLDFEDSSNLGNDASTNTNDWAENNIAAADQATDTPTNNFCTLNPIDTATDSSATFKITEGNLVLGDSGSNDNDMGLRATMGVLGGKWYWEVKKLETAGTIGIVSSHTDVTGGDVVNNDSVCSRNISSNGTGSSLVYWNNTTFTNDASLQGYAANDIIGVALDMDNGKLYFSINGTFKGFDNNASDPAAGTNANFTDIPTDKGFIMPYVEKRGSADPSDQFNFGGCPAFSVSSGNADGKGYGNFEYSPPSGFLALCTKNLGSTGG